MGNISTLYDIFDSSKKMTTNQIFKNKKFTIKILNFSLFSFFVLLFSKPTNDNDNKR